MTQTLPRPARAQRPHRVRRWPGRLLPVAVILCGVIVLVHPVGMTGYHDHDHQRQARQHHAEIDTTDPVLRNNDLAEAEAYNARLPGTTLWDPWSTGGPQADPLYQTYLTQLHRHEAMARLRIPAIGSLLPIHHGTSSDTLTNGVGHLYGTTLPVGGPGTHAVLTAHSGMQHATLFDRLPDLEKGDVFSIDVAGKTLAYRVDEIQVVLPTELDRLARRQGEDLITLVTCTPYAVNTHRLFVTGTRIAYEQDLDPGESHPFTGWQIQPWMQPRLGAAAVAVFFAALMVVGWPIAGRWPHRRRTTPPDRPTESQPSS